jgi:hypothetical protein
MTADLRWLTDHAWPLWLAHGVDCTGANVLALGKQRRRGRLVHLFDAAPAIVVQFSAITLSTSPISKLRAANDERQQTACREAGERGQACRGHQTHSRGRDGVAVRCAVLSRWQSR